MIYTGQQRSVGHTAPPSVFTSCVQHDGPGREDSSDLLAAPALAPSTNSSVHAWREFSLANQDGAFKMDRMWPNRLCAEPKRVH
jgi:hypothetical protein